MAIRRPCPGSAAWRTTQSCRSGSTVSGNRATSPTSTGSTASTPRRSSTLRRAPACAPGTDRLFRLLLRATAHRGGMAGQFEAAGIGQLVAVDLQHREILVDEVADIEVRAIGAERRALGQGANRHLADIGHFLAVDLEDADGAAGMIEPAGLRLVRTARLDRDREVALGAESQPLG